MFSQQVLQLIRPTETVAFKCPLDPTQRTVFQKEKEKYPVDQSCIWMLWLPDRYSCIHRVVVLVHIAYVLDLEFAGFVSRALKMFGDQFQTIKRRNGSEKYLVSNFTHGNGSWVGFKCVQ